MNKSIFTNTGGLKLHQERLKELQDSYAIFNALGFLAGDYSIIDGCTYNATNGTTSDGILFVDGEVIEFRGGTTQASIIINETNVDRQYNDGQIKTVHKIRWASFGTGSGSMAWSNFLRCYPTRGLEALLSSKASNLALQALTARVQTLESINAVFQAAGGVILWMKPADQIPAGWAEYEPMQGKFPVGLDPDDPTFSNLGGEGGSKTKQLSISEMPAHSHNIKLWDEQGAGAPAGGSAGGITNGTGSTESTGFGNSFSILNPHRIVYFIHRVG